MPDLSQIEALTFDCYGTLVDWETGILAAVKDVLSRHGAEPPPGDELLRWYADLEAEHEAGTYRRTARSSPAHSPGSRHGAASRTFPRGTSGPSPSRSRAGRCSRTQALSWPALP